MDAKPKAAGKSSFGHIDQDLAFDSIIVGPRATYLDLGCGAGLYALSLARRLKAGSMIYALDLWEDGIAALAESARREGLGNIEPMVADLSQPLRLDAGSIDAAYMATVLHDLPESARSGLIVEVSRVLVPGGRFSIIEFKKLDHGPGPSMDKRIGSDDAEQLVAPFGFVQDGVAELGEFTYIARYIKP